ncbi:hypothetical protein [Flavobacterium ranwuense]|uniref:hypothetical protein n=1 Tax=Flavobacterium ranwuense TaxID=2541725 RepID=UPI0014054826|nr:hypothetical protein [Flavobacterium ranwuense]
MEALFRTLETLLSLRVPKDVDCSGKAGLAADKHYSKTLLILHLTSCHIYLNCVIFVL